MKEIGGYFELELDINLEYHIDAIRLNTARNALEYLLRSRKYGKIFIPYFTCDVILEPIKKLEVEFEFYKIDKNLEPVFDLDNIKENEGFLYTNYFGLKDVFISKLSKLCRNLIIDNAQSFFSKPIENIDTFYSPRKFFGVPDGSYLHSNKKLDVFLEKDKSYERFEHLLRRIDESAQNGYSFFIENDQKLSNQPIKVMSALTKTLLAAINYKACAIKRRENFLYLHKHLKKSNLLKIEFDVESVPMLYPYWSKKQNLKKILIENKIFSPTYWHNVLEWCNPNDLESELTRETIYLPIDQRHTIKDMERIIYFLNKY
jgi:hypothetical protein